MLFVMLVSVVLFFFIRVDQPVLRLVLRILLIPVIAGISYEIIRLAGRSDNILVRMISAPGLWLQKLTTKEPDEDMIEVAIAAIEAVFDWKAYFKTEFDYDVDVALEVAENSERISKEMEEDQEIDVDTEDTRAAREDAAVTEVDAAQEADLPEIPKTENQE